MSMICPAAKQPCHCGEPGRPSPCPPVARQPFKVQAVNLRVDSRYPDDNPKTALGVMKVPMGLLPAPAVALVAMAFADGKQKYGRANWRDKPVTWSTYDDAMMRHRALYESGEQIASDSKVHHLAHLAACAMILLDAEMNGKLNDDRPTPFPGMQELLDRLSDQLKEKANG